MLLVLSIALARFINTFSFSFSYSNLSKFFLVIDLVMVIFSLFFFQVLVIHSKIQENILVLVLLKITNVLVLVVYSYAYRYLLMF